MESAITAWHGLRRSKFTTPYRAEEMSALAVSPLVNSARLDDPQCCQSVESPEAPEKLRIVRKEPLKPDGQQTLGL